MSGSEPKSPATRRSLVRALGPALIAVGFVGFLGMDWLPAVGTWLSSVELPTFFETNTIGLPDGGRLTATSQLSACNATAMTVAFEWLVRRCPLASDLPLMARSLFVPEGDASFFSSILTAMLSQLSGGSRVNIGWEGKPLAKGK